MHQRGHIRPLLRQTAYGSELKERWSEQLIEREGVRFTSWDEHQGVAPIKRLNNPRLFWGDKILAGTFAGMQDPFMLFGVHGALISGKIAATAVDHKAEAYDMFRKMTGFFKYSLLVKWALDLMPHPVRATTIRSLMGLWTGHMEGLGFLMESALHTIPGFKTM